MTNIIEHVKNHATQILLIVIIFSITIVALKIFAHDANARVLIIIFMSVTYVIWGVVYHAIQKDLTVKIALEYLVFSILLCLSALLMLVWS